MQLHRGIVSEFAKRRPASPGRPRRKLRAPADRVRGYFTVLKDSFTTRGVRNISSSCLTELRVVVLKR
jgi:hypothetical protein